MPKAKQDLATIKVKVANFSDFEEIIELVKQQVQHLYRRYDANFTKEDHAFQKYFSQKGTLSGDEMNAYSEEHGYNVPLYLLRKQNYYWNYKNALDKLIILQKAFDEWNYQGVEDQLEMSEDRYGLFWEG